MRLLLALFATIPVFAQYAAPSQVFSRLFGGASGSDSAGGLAVDGSGNVAVVGTTDSPDFPVTAGAYQSQMPQLPLASVTSTGVSYPSLSAVNVTALAASVDGSVVYAGSASGIFRSADGGQTWTRQSDSFIDAIAVAVDGGSVNTVYACLYGFIGPTIAPGIYKSTDGGVTWAFNSNLCRGTLLTPAQLPGVVYSAYGALYRSTDGGVTWSGNLTPHNYNTFATALAPSDPNVLYTVPSDGQLYRSSDGGNTWTAPGGSFTAYPNTNANLYIVALAVDSKNENIVWALNHAGTLWRSTDGGATFAIVQQTGPNPQGPAYLSISGSNIIAGQMLSLDGGSTWSNLPSVGYLSSALALPQSILIGSSAALEYFLAKWNSDGSAMLFSTFLTGDDAGSAQPPVVASDSAGDTWVASSTLMKFDPSGKLLLSKSLAPFIARNIALDPSGSAYLSLNNYNVSTTDCTAPAAQNGAVPLIMKFDSQGNAVYSNSLSQLCFGGISGLAVDASGAVYLAGSTQSTALQTTSTALQSTAPPPVPMPPYGSAETAGFLAILSPQGTQLTYLSYIGGSGSAAGGVAVDAAGNVYVTGETLATGFPFGSCSQSTSTQSFVFVVKLNPSSPLPAWVNAPGGCDLTAHGTQVAVDASGNVWVGGTTYSGQFPTVAPLEVEGYHLAFLSEISPDGSQLLLSSYAPGKFALGPEQTLYLAGAGYPNPAKIGVQVFGSAGQTSAEIEEFRLNQTQAAVIDSISSINPPTGGDTRFLTIAPGELIKLTGRGLGPSTAVGAQLDSNGRVANSLAGTRVLFDGIPGPLISVQDSTIECVAPFEIGPRTSTSVQIERNGSAPPGGVVIGVTPEAFYASVLAVVNADGTLNSQSNPSHAGQPVILYVTGFGDTNPPVPDGTVYQSPLPVPIYPPSPYQLAPFYMGPAPGMVAGIWQVNLPPPPPPQTPGNPVELGVDTSYTIDGYYPSASAPVWITQ